MMPASVWVSLPVICLPCKIKMTASAVIFYVPYMEHSFDKTGVLC